jgi:uncharacterized protein DUF5666
VNPISERFEKRPSRRSPILLAGVLLAGWILIHENAQPGFAQDSSFTLEGKISEKSDGKLTVSTTDNIIFHVRYDDKTEIKRADGSAGTGADLKVGQTVAVAGELAESGEIIAKKIEIKAKEN